MKTILKFFFQFKKTIYLALFIKFIGSCCELVLPWLLSYIIDDIIPLENIGLIFLYGGIMVLFSIMALVLNISANRLASKTAMLTTRNIRYELFGKIQNLSSQQIDKMTISSLVSRMSNDTYNVQGMLGSIQRMGVRAPILLIGGILVTLTLDPMLTLVLVACMPVIFATVYIVSKKGVPLYKIVQEKIDKLILVVRENITGVRVIKSLSREEYEKNRFRQVNEENRKANEKAMITMGITNPIMSLILNMGLVCVVFIGAYRVDSGVSQPGKIIAFTTYFTIILNAMIAITRMFIMISKASASASRMSEILLMPDELKVEENKNEYNNVFIEFKNVSFSYNKKKPTIDNVSFIVNKGESLGIVGLTGSGKTTVISLLLRFYDCDSGEILIYGRNIKTYTLQELRSIFGVVFQDDYIYNDSIYKNIDFMRECEYNDIINSATSAKAKDFIDECGGFDKDLTSRGTNISGGQKQRILIARALSNKPKCLILDDASSALDYKTDAELRQNIRNINLTSIVIAQRISSVMTLDKILVLENGKISGIGKHEELLDTVELYNNIAKVQLGGDYHE